MMHVLVQTLELQLPGCQSLKEKRRRVGRLRDRFGKYSQIAVCESDYADRHGQSQWSFVLAGNSRPQLESIASEVELFAATELDAILLSCDQEWL